MIKKIFKTIKEYDEIVIARHIGPDPDAVASQIALRDSIRLTFPNKKVYAVGAGVAKFKYLGSLDKIDEEQLTNPLLIVVDNPNTIRLDSANHTKYKDIILIDHHPKEDLFNLAKFSYVDEASSSAAQLVANLIMNSKLKINKEIAGNLFIGIVADSDRFLLGYTTYNTFKTAYQLLKKYKFDITELYAKLYERPISEVKFQAYIATNLIVTNNKFGYIILEDKTLKEMGVDSSSASNMINDFNYIKELYCWAFASYDTRNNLYKVNIRSRGPIINEVANRYNGGGHKLASGARIAEVSDVDNLFKDLDKACEEYVKGLNEDK